MSESMNFVGSIAVMDRGDAPAQAVLDRNARSLAKRVADETKEELGKVMKRVEYIYGNYEWSTQLFQSSKEHDIEYINDMTELENLLKDPVKMTKYKKGVTIFVVGYENVCGQKLRLLQQVNEFFMENATKIDEDDSQVQTPDIELDDMMDTIDDTLKKTEDLATKLGDLNKEMVSYMYEYAHAKASTKSKKKLEKALNQAKDDISALNEKLLQLQQETEEKEDRLQQMFKQIEVKNMEAQRYKTAAEVAKKSAEEADSLREQCLAKDDQMRDLKKEIDRLLLDLGEAGIDNKLKSQRLSNAAAETNSKIMELQQNLDNQVMDMGDAKRELQRLHDKQIEDMSVAHRDEMEELKAQHSDEIKQLLEKLEELKSRLNYTQLQLSETADVDQYKTEAEDARKAALMRAASADAAKVRLAEVEQERDYANAEVAKQQAEVKTLQQEKGELKERLENQPTKVVEVVKEVVKEVEVIKEVEKIVEVPVEKPEDDQQTDKPEIEPTASPELEEVIEEQVDVGNAREEIQKPGSKQSGKPEVAEVSIQDEGGDADTAQVEVTRSPAVDPVHEVIMEFEDEFELRDEESWSQVPPEHVPGRFLQFRKLTTKKLHELESSLETTVKKTTRKVQTLKAQFHEHKKRWESERVVLIEQIDQAATLQNQAEKEADLAMQQLEEFINGQEELEQEEEEKRRGIESMSREPTLSLVEAEENLQRTLTEQAQAEQEEQERLLSQTDDAKAMSRKTTTGEASTETPPPRSAMRSPGLRSKAATRVSFAPPSRRDAEVQVLTDDQLSMMESIENMLANEPNLPEAQRQVLNMVRAVILTKDAKIQTDEPLAAESVKSLKSRTLTIFTLASHLSHESIKLGVQPSSVFKTFASMNKRVTSAHHDVATEMTQLREKSMSFVLAETPAMLEEALRKITVHDANDPKELSKTVDQLGLDPELIQFPTFATMGSDFHGPTETPEPSIYMSEATAALSRTQVSSGMTPPQNTLMSEEATQHQGEGQPGDASSASEQKAGTPDARESSARSRASLRDQHRSVLESLRKSATDRRSKSPAIDTAALAKSELDSMELDEDGDMPFPPDLTKEERIMHDMGTSPIIFSKEGTRITFKSEKSIPVADHPIVQEYLKVYDTMVHFKEALSTFFMDRDMTSMSQVLMDIERVLFDREDKVQPQVEEMTFNIANILEDTLQLVTSAVSNDREYPVSSLLGGLSRDQTRSILFTRERTGVPLGPLPSRGGVRTAMSENIDTAVQEKYNELQQEHEKLQQNHDNLQVLFREETKKREDQLNHNTVVMMEMQDTIHALQRELSMMGQKVQQPVAQGARSQTPIMFTRLDSERNAKMMKRAVNEERLPVEKYQTAVEAMDRYVDIPSRRMAHLAAKYVHHTQMKQIEDAVRRSNNLDENVFHVLDKMEALQNDRAQRWAEKMDALGSERLQLANFLMITLDEIERESGIFLIKPMFSYRAPSKTESVQGKLSRPYKPARDVNISTNGLAPIPTPMTQTRRSTVPGTATYTPHPPLRKADDPVDGVSGKQTELVGEYPHATWNPSLASPRYPDTDVTLTQAQVNTPRILELDINRMLIGQNQISMNIPQSFLSKDRLANAANLSTRTYATLSRPAGQESRGRSSNRPRSGSKVSDSAPPTTPLRNDTPLSAGSSSKRVDVISEKGDSAGTSRTIPQTPPLPPIPQRDENAEEEVRERTLPMPPASPPGSSIRRSPSYVPEMSMVSNPPPPTVPVQQ